MFILHTFMVRMGMSGQRLKIIKGCFKRIIDGDLSLLFFISVYLAEIPSLRLRVCEF